MNPKAYILSKFPGKSPNASGKIHARCPFHNDAHPSFSIDVNKGLFVCGSSKCGVRGNFLLFYKLSEGIKKWSEVYKQLKDSHVELDIDKLLCIEKTISQQDLVNPWPQPEFLGPLIDCQYLTNRGLDQTVIDQFGLHYGKFGSSGNVSLHNSIVSPVFELDGSYKTFQVRYLNPNTYRRWQFPINSPIQNMLYGGWLINSRTPHLWIVEGASDVWKLYSYGAQSVGLFTKSATSAQFNKIFYLCTLYDLIPVVCLDGDVWFSKARKDPIKKLYCELEAFGLTPKVLELERKEDPGNLSYERFQTLQSQLEGGVWAQ